jgi:hypothetical protein
MKKSSLDFDHSGPASDLRMRSLKRAEARPIGTFCGSVETLEGACISSGNYSWRSTLGVITLALRTRDADIFRAEVSGQSSLPPTVSIFSFSS